MSGQERVDYIVVGAGSAGCVLAARLSEDPTTRVALVESGPTDRGRLFELPGLYGLQLKSLFDWDLQSEPEPGLNGRRAYLPRGRVLGGTSSMNTMVYIRGHREDYDGWAARGAHGWGYADVLPYFRRSEDNERGASVFHGSGGPLAVSDARYVHPLIESWVQAAVEAGHPLNADFNGADQEGVGIYQMTQRDGLRASTAAAFLRPARERANLSVYTGAHALRLLWHDTRAAGVEFDHRDDVRVLTAEREVVLCAGAYMSPQLLMLSGVGAPTHLEDVGVSPLVDLPAVGQNLQDHPGCFLSYPSLIPDLREADTAENEAMLRREGAGPLGWTEAGGFLRTDSSLRLPDVQFHVAPGMFKDEGLAAPLDHALSFGPYVNRPESRGRVLLRSALPYAKPRILHNYLTEQRDRVSLREGIRLAMEIARQPPLRGQLKDPRLALEMGLVPESDSDAAIDAFIRASAFSFFHPSGTCAIGAVVDEQLRVFGVDGLRVADASVIPCLIGGNTNAPAIMIAEKAADLIRGLDPPPPALL